MDIQLPEISGLEVTKLLKEDEDLRLIPVIAVTAFAMKGDREKSAAADARTTSPNRYLLRAFCRLSNVFSYNFVLVMYISEQEASS